MPDTSSIDLAELLHELGDISDDRIVWDIGPGTATIEDMRDDAFPMCELIDGTIVRKAMGFDEGYLGICLATWLNVHIMNHNLGTLVGGDVLVELRPSLLQGPDIAYTPWDRYPNRQRDGAAIAKVVPILVVEVLSLSNRAGEMRRKRTEYFAAGVKRVWQIDPRKRIVEVFTDDKNSTILIEHDTLDANDVVPDFTLDLSLLFAQLDRHG